MNIFSEARYREQMAPLMEQKPARGQHKLAWDRVKELPFGSVRHSVLMFLASGGKLRKSDADSLVFGGNGERRNYLTKSGLGFDTFVHERAYELLSDGAIVYDELDAMNELCDIVQSVTSSRQAREILVQHYLDTHGTIYKPNRKAKQTTIKPAF